MPRYSEEYWEDITSGVFGMDEAWKCKITDSETGLSGTSSSHSSKHHAHDDAWDDLQSQIRIQEFWGSSSNNSSENLDFNKESSLDDDNNSYNDNSSDANFSINNESFYTGDYSSYGGTTAANVAPNEKKQTSNSDLSILFILIVVLIVLFGLIELFVKISAHNQHPVNKIEHFQSSSSSVNVEEVENEKLKESRIKLLTGNWIKINGWMEKGIIVSFSNNMGNIISVPSNDLKYRIGAIEWKNFNPERNWIQVYVHFSDGYLNFEINFRDSETIKLSNGDTYKKQN